MTYTAAEMREMADGYDGLVNLERLAMRPERVKTYSVTAAMLRQAADAMDTFDGVRDAMADEIQALRDEAEITPAKD